MGGGTIGVSAASRWARYDQTPDTTSITPITSKSEPMILT
jgi:hypothetical protein